jgi:AcrR family transcriptional regulator
VVDVVNPIAHHSAMTGLPSTKEQLVAVATRLLDEGGPQAVTLRSVAHALGLSHTAPDKHFTDKRALLAAVAHISFQEMGAAFTKVAQKEKTPLRALRQIVGQYLDFAERSPHRYRLLFNDPEIGQERGELETEALATFEAVVRLIKAAQKEGELKKGDASQFTALLYGSLHGLADLRLSGRARSAKGMEDVGVLPLILLDLLKK